MSDMNPVNPENRNHSGQEETSASNRRNRGVERLARLTQTLARFDLRPRDVLVGGIVITVLAGALLWNPRPLNNDILPVSTSVEQCNAEQLGVQVYSSKNYFGPTNDVDYDVDDYFIQGLEVYLKDYSDCDIGRFFVHNNLNFVIFSDPVSMKVTAEDGIVLHDFPDKRPLRSRKIPTNGPDGGPNIKAFYWGHEIPGKYQVFVFERDPKTHQLINIWAAYLSKDGGWPFSPKPYHPEFFRVAGINPETRKIEPFVSMENTKQQAVSLKEFLGLLDLVKSP